MLRKIIFALAFILIIPVSLCASEIYRSINDIIRDINIYWEEKGSKIDILESEYKFKVLKNKISDDGTDIVYTLNGSIDLIYKENGDLYITIHIKAPVDYKADGNNILKTITLAPYEAVLGANIEITTINGNYNIKIGT